MNTIGIDIGSLTTKAVILNGDAILASTIVNSDDEAELGAKITLDKALEKAGIGPQEESYIVSTGVHGKEISLSKKQKAITTCMARGIHHVFPEVRMVIDMGAESSTVIKVNERGRVSDWANQDKCAAGTGIFLQQMAKLMQMPIEKMSDISFNSQSPADITSTCAVFAESEVISSVHRDPPIPMEDIAAGIFSSVISRIMALCKRVGIEREVAITGGVALNKGLVNILEKELGFRVMVPEAPRTVAALGAAIIARENISKGMTR